MTHTLDTPLNHEQLRVLDAYWRAANYLSVDQIYLLDNPLLTDQMHDPIQDRLHDGTGR